MAPEKHFEQIDELIYAFLQGKATNQEVDALKDWITISKINRDYFKQTYMIWKSVSLSKMNTDKIEKDYQKVCQKIIVDSDDNIPTLRDTNTVPFSRSLMKWAALIILSMGIGSLLTTLLQKSGLDSGLALNIINVPLGSQSHIVLPDGSEVWLNAGSKLTYLTDYGKEMRNVNLEGEGYFKVAKITEKPFIVHTVKANIKALGTEFNVKAYPDENTIETILVEGSVVVDKIGSGKSDKSDKENGIILKPGQKVLIFKNLVNRKPKDETNPDIAKYKTDEITPTIKRIEKGIDLQESNPAIETSWKDPNWVIQGESVEDVFTKLGRRFNISIEMVNDDLNKYKFSGIIQNETLEQVFDLMSLTIPMAYQIEKGKAEVRLNPNLEQKYKDAYKK